MPHRPLTVSELIEALLALDQPHARVELTAECAYCHEASSTTLTVTGAHSRLGVAVLEVKEKGC